MPVSIFWNCFPQNFKFLGLTVKFFIHFEMIFAKVKIKNVF